MAGKERPAQIIDWAPGGLELRIEVGHDGMARLTRLAPPGGPGSWPDLASGGRADAALPLLAAAILPNGPSTYKNVPQLQDVADQFR